MMATFLQAYICRGIVTRTKETVTGSIADPLSRSLQAVYAYSERKSSKPRDYILALMAQCTWYRSPDDAKRMSFTEIFLDLNRQAMSARKGFACRITESMTRDCTVEEAWAPSSDQPEPMCLGDFILLLGRPLDQAPRADVPGPMHLVTLVAVTNADESSDNAHASGDESLSNSAAWLEQDSESCSDDIHMSAPFLEIIRAAMEFSHYTWYISERAGELTKYGTSPEQSFNYDLQRELKDVKDNSEERVRYREFVKKRQDQEHRWASEEQYVTEQATKCLSLMFGSTPRSAKTQRAKDEWTMYVQSRDGDWPIQLRRMMLLMAAMVGCKVPLSAAWWVRQRFLPVLIRLDEHGEKYLGLLSKRHSTTLLSEKSKGSQPSFHVFVASRGYSDSNRGKDLVILHPVSKTPVGLVPDFSHDQMAKEEWRERMIQLYGRLYASDCECRASHFAFLPLDNLDRADVAAFYHVLLARTEESSKLDDPCRRKLKQLAHAVDN